VSRKPAKVNRPKWALSPAEIDLIHQRHQNFSWSEEVDKLLAKQVEKLVGWMENGSCIGFDENHQAIRPLTSIKPELKAWSDWVNSR